MLFESSTACRELLGIKLHKVDSSSEQVFLDYLMQSEYDRVSFYSSFYYLYPLTKTTSNNIEFYYALYNGWMCVFEYSVTSKLYVIKNSLINKDGDYSGLAKMYRFFVAFVSKLNDNANKVKKIYNIFDHDINAYFDLSGLSTERNYKEFIFRCSDLINLSGKHYKSRRNMVNQLKSQNPSLCFRRYTSDDKQSVIDLYNLWIADYTSRLKGEEVVNVGLVEYTLAQAEISNNYDIFVGVINDKIEGFIVIVPLCKNTKCVLIEYTNVDVRGLAEFLWYEGLKNTNAVGEYENDGTGGSEKDGLFFYKNSHRPIAFLETHSINLNKRGSKISRGIFKHSTERDGE